MACELQPSNSQGKDVAIYMNVNLKFMISFERICKIFPKVNSLTQKFVAKFIIPKTENS